jgi:hypothetical protein
MTTEGKLPRLFRAQAAQAAQAARATAGDRDAIQCDPESIEFVDQRGAGGPPEVGEILDLIQFFGKRKGEQMVGQVDIAANGDRP